MKELEMVRDFHVATCNPVAPRPQIPPNDRVRLRAKLIMEEALETVCALLGHENKVHVKQFVELNNRWIDECVDPQTDLVEVADGLCDLIYVSLGCAVEMGLPIEELFAEVHRSNMLKVGASKRADGKTMKPEGWQPPYLGKILDLYA